VTSDVQDADGVFLAIHYTSSTKVIYLFKGKELSGGSIIVSASGISLLSIIIVVTPLTFRGWFTLWELSIVSSSVMYLLVYVMATNRHCKYGCESEISKYGHLARY
jgi:hypothetical protein